MPETLARWVRWFLVGLWLVGLAIIINTWQTLLWSAVMTGGGIAMISVGSLMGLIGVFLLLTQLVLASGIPPIERAIGLDRMFRWHSYNGPVAYVMIMSHVMLMVMGYSSLTERGWLEQLLNLINNLPYVLFASLAVLALNAVVLSSVVIIRRRLRYEWWRIVHWLAYAVVLLAFLHQINNGPVLRSVDGFRYFWWVIYSGAIGSVLYMRIIRPLLLYRQYRWRVDEVVPQADNVTSIYVTGNNLERFKYSAGQFNFWYFWQPGFRTQKHPFTISSSPGDSRLRLSAKALGDFTTALRNIKKGTPVLINGPFGRFTSWLASDRPRLFIAGGIGITPIRSMLGDEIRPGDTLIYSARTAKDLVFKKEFDKWSTKGLVAHCLLSDEKVSQKGYLHGKLDADLIKQLVPDVSTRDVWLCGPPAMNKIISKELRALDLNRRHIHTEKFSL